MELKFYAYVPDSLSALKYYKNLFKADVIKGQQGGHVYLKLFGQIGFHIYGVKKMDTSRGRLIIRFHEGERKEYDDLLVRIKESTELQINRFNEEFTWGTSLTEIQDKYGYVWVFEANSK